MPPRRAEFVVVSSDPDGWRAKGIARAIRDVIVRWRYRHIRRRDKTYMVRRLRLSQTKKGGISSRQPFRYHADYSILVISAVNLGCGAPGSLTPRGKERRVSLPKARSIVRMAKCPVVLIDLSYDPERVSVRLRALRALIVSTGGRIIESQYADSRVAEEIVRIRGVKVAHRQNLRPGKPEPGWDD